MIPEKTRPNVIVFFTDQQRWDTSGLHGNPMGLTPNLDRLGHEHTHVANSFTCQPVCGPARSCFQTGMYATTTGCFRNGISLPIDCTTLGHYFRDAGYRTGYIGKWHLYNQETKGPVPAKHRFGYDYWLASNVLEFTSDAYDTELYNNEGNSIKLPGYRVDAVTDALIRFVAESEDEPFFLFTSFIEPHHQNHRDDYPAPDGYREAYTGGWIPPDLAELKGSAHRQLGGYYGMVKRLDEAYGRVHDALKSLHLDNNTIVLFTSDHGCHFRTRNGEYKRSCHESSIRVPTVFTGPGFRGAGRLEELVSLVDLPPTLLDAAGIEVPPSMQGRSLMPLLRREKNNWPEEVFIQISESQTGRAVRTSRWKYGVDAPEAKGPSADCYVEQYLYDLEADPYELNNLIGLESHAPVAQFLSERLSRRMCDAGEDKPRIESAHIKPAGQYRVSDLEVRS
ncbi:MAG: sulfatase-like hydrolase/transferase [Candidatus Latescibacterota bacterium]|nr:sulfatase-like hydrolase/transferase [Candidatus Latescibacterota bacterium]